LVLALFVTSKYFIINKNYFYLKVIWMQGKLGNVLTLNTNRITMDGRFEIVQQPIESKAPHLHIESRIADSSQNGKASKHSKKPHHHNHQGGFEGNNEASGGHRRSFNGAHYVRHIAQQQNELIYYNLKINNLQIYDENEYACETSITKHHDEEPSLHSLFYLHVTRK
jgi:hypothetical protein